VTTAWFYAIFCGQMIPTISYYVQMMGFVV